MSRHGSSVDVTLDLAQEADLPDFKKALQRAFMLAVVEEMGRRSRRSRLTRTSKTHCRLPALSRFAFSPTGRGWEVRSLR